MEKLKSMNNMILQSTLWCIDYNGIEVEMRCDVDKVKNMKSEQMWKWRGVILIVNLLTSECWSLYLYHRDS